jgi:hypothetical protein
MTTNYLNSDNGRGVAMQPFYGKTTNNQNAVIRNGAVQVRNQFYFMRNNSLLKTACLIILLGLSVINTGAQTLVLNATDSLCISSSDCTNWTDTLPVAPGKCETGGFWKNTYNDNVLKFDAGNFTLTHQSGATIYSYWGGFTTGSNGNKLCYTGKCPDSCNCRAACVDSLGSGDWVLNQWGVMAGGGLDANYATVPGDPYFIAYWNYYQDDQGNPSLQISLADGSLFAPQEVYICNHPWPYYGNIYGDGFARPLNQMNDHFDLWIHAVKADGRQDSTQVILAEYISGDRPKQDPDWQQISLANLFEEDNDSIQYLYFTMYSTDNSAQYGPNTAVYFDMDKLTVIKQGKAPISAGARKAPTPTTPKVAEVADYFPLTSYTGGDVVVYTPEGKEAWRTTVKAGEKPNLSKLPAGEYRLRHGHRSIPIKKVN